MGPRLTNLLGKGDKYSAGLARFGASAYPPWGRFVKAAHSSVEILSLALPCLCCLDLKGSLLKRLRQRHPKSHVFHMISSILATSVVQELGRGQSQANHSFDMNSKTGAAAPPSVASATS